MDDERAKQEWRQLLEATWDHLRVTPVRELIDAATAKTAADTPAGNHKSLFCQVTVTVNGEPVVFRAGGTQLQVDKPLPKIAKKLPPQPKPTQQAAKPEKRPEKPAKPLSRLEKLRLAAQQLRAERLKKLNESP